MGNKKRKNKLPPAPLCAHCGEPAHLVTGREVYPHRPDLYGRNLWKCTPCNAWVGCHKGGPGTRSLGRPANLELRNARSKLHEDRLDPIWKGAIDSGAYRPEDQKASFIIRAAARSRVYAYLAHHMGLEINDCHVGMFTLEQCRQAWTILFRKTYPEIRDWCAARRIEKALAEHSFSLVGLAHEALNECEGCRKSWPIVDGAHASGPCTARALRDRITWLEQHSEEHVAAITAHNTAVMTGLDEETNDAAAERVARGHLNQGA